MSRAAALLLLGCLLPFGVLAAYLALEGVDVPFFDQWMFLDNPLRRAYEGNLTFQALHVQHGPHRLLFPKALMVALALLTDWNTHYERLTSLVLNGLTFLGIVLIYRRSGAVPWSVPTALAVFVTACLMSSLHQWENLLWGFQVQVFLCNCAVVWMIVTLTPAGPLSAWRVIAGGMLAFIASFSFGNGPLAWPLGLVLVFRSAPVGRRGWTSAVWLLFALAASWFWLSGYIVYPSHEPRGHPLVNVLWGCFVLTGNSLIGMGLVPQSIVGGVGVLMLGWLLRRASRTHGGCSTLLPLLAVLAYGVGNTIVLAGFRVRRDVGEARAPRYVTLTVFLWISVALLVGLLAGRGARRRRAASWRLAGLLVLILGALAWTQPQSGRVARHFTRRLQGLCHSLVSGELHTVNFIVTEYPETIGWPWGQEYLLRHRLSLFRDESRAERARYPCSRIELAAGSDGKGPYVELSGGRPGNSAWLYAVAGENALELGTGVIGRDGTWRVRLPLPNDAMDISVSLIAAALDGHHPLAVSQQLHYGH